MTTLPTDPVLRSITDDVAAFAKRYAKQKKCSTTLVVQRASALDQEYKDERQARAELASSLGPEHGAIRESLLSANEIIASFDLQRMERDLDVFPAQSGKRGRPTKPKAFSPSRAVGRPRVTRGYDLVILHEVTRKRGEEISILELCRRVVREVLEIDAGRKVSGYRDLQEVEKWARRLRSRYYQARPEIEHELPEFLASIKL